MSASAAAWAAILVGALGCYLLKLAGLSVPPRVLEHPGVERVARLLPVALLAALVAVQSVVAADAVGSRLMLDARLVALGVAAVLLWLRAPFLLVVVGAAAVAAGARALGLLG